jgi:hypothetical protein
MEISNPCARILVYWLFTFFPLFFSFWFSYVFCWVSYLAYPNWTGKKAFDDVVAFALPYMKQSQYYILDCVYQFIHCPVPTNENFSHLVVQLFIVSALK